MVDFHVILLKLFSKVKYKMNWSCTKKCERCKKYKEKYLQQETRNDELLEMLESLLETQKKIAEYIENKKVVGVECKK